MSPNLVLPVVSPKGPSRFQKDPIVSRNKSTRNRYNRIAFIYDLMEAPLEFLRLASWREKLIKIFLQISSGGLKQHLKIKSKLEI